MNKLLNPEIYISQEGENIPTEEVLQNQEHSLTARTDTENGDIYLEFSSRLAMYDFARSLLHEAIYGIGDQMEFYALGPDGPGGNYFVVDGVRLSPESSRIFVFHPK